MVVRYNERRKERSGAGDIGRAFNGRQRYLTIHLAAANEFDTEVLPGF